MGEPAYGSADDQARIVTIIGTCLPALLPEELDLFFENGVLVDRRNGTPMEMDAYSLFLALAAMERRTGRNLREQRKRLVDAVVDRLRAKNGFWTHGAWTKSETEVHLRFTAAAIRLLVEALCEGLLSDTRLVADALRKHLGYADSTAIGLWFLHDSLEVPGLSDYYRTPNPYRAWGAASSNCLVLNTHVDTLITLLDIVARVKLQDDDRRFFIEQINAGLKTLEAALAVDLPGNWPVLDHVDSLIRAVLFRSLSSRAWLVTKFRRLIEKTYFPVRLRFKRRYPRFTLADGYLERDVGLPGTAYVYHITNIYDLARLAARLKGTDFHQSEALTRRCNALVDRGLNYAAGKSYRSFIRSTGRGEGIVLCDALLARLGTMDAGPVPQSWISTYCEIRRKRPRSAAILGYDPLVVRPTHDGGPVERALDSGTLLNGKRFAIDLKQDRLTLAPAEDTVAS